VGPPQPAGQATAEGGGGGRASSLLVQTHSLHQLMVNGRQALPAPLLAGIRRAELSSPESLQAVSDVLLRATEGALAPLPRSSAAARTSPLAQGGDTPASAAFALGFVAVLRAIQDGAPALLTREPDLSLASEKILVRGLLREPLLQGRSSVGAALRSSRQGYAALVRDGALTAEAEAPVLSSTQLEPDGSLLVSLRLPASIGSNGAPPPLRAGLPLELTASMVCRLDTATGMLTEVWIKALAINGRPLLPALLSRWVQQASEPPSAAPPPWGDVSAFLSVLVPWISA